MNKYEVKEALAQSVSLSEDGLVAELADGRTITRAHRVVPAFGAQDASGESQLASDCARRRDPLAGPR